MFERKRTKIDRGSDQKFGQKMAQYLRAFNGAAIEVSFDAILFSLLLRLTSSLVVAVAPCQCYFCVSEW